MGLFKKKAPASQKPKEKEYGPINRLVRGKIEQIKQNKAAQKIKATANLKFNQIKNALKLKPAKVKITYEALVKEYSSQEITTINQKLNLLEKKAEESHKRIQELKNGFLKDTNNVEAINRKVIAQKLLKGEEIKEIPRRLAINPESLQPNQGSKPTNKTLKQLEAGDRELKTRELDKYFTKEKKNSMLSREVRKEVENARTINREIASLQSIRFNEVIKNQLSFGNAIETKQAREIIVKSLYQKYNAGAIDLPALRDLIKYLSVEIEIAKKMNIINSAESANTYHLGSAELINQVSDVKEIKKRFKFF